jgi:thiol:disulfide interchange protein
MKRKRVSVTAAATVFLLCLAPVTAWAQDGLGIKLGGAEPQGPAVRVDVRRESPEDTSLVRLRITFHMPADVYVYREESHFFKVEQTEAEGLGSLSLTLPPARKHRNFDGTVVEVFRNGQSVVASWPVAASPWRLKGQVRYQACNETMCFIPQQADFAFASPSAGASGGPEVTTAPADDGGETWRDLVQGFDIAGRLPGYQNPEQLLESLREAEAGDGGAGPFAGMSVWLVLLALLLGGLALNMTPCVLPMLPVTLAVIGAGARARSRGRGFAVGMVYGAGMAIAYGAAGAAVIMTGASFGALNASPLFNIAIACVFVALALAMFDIVHIDFTRYRTAFGAGTPGAASVLAVFGMGAVAALLAGACVAPVVISVIVYATALYAEGNVGALLLPFVLGVGMAVPWPLAGAGLSLLPRPGRWMVWVRNLFGVVILVLAVYYGYTGVKLYMDFRPQQMDAPAEEAESGPGLAWRSSLREGLAEARGTGRPVFIDFWATWCKNCLWMDATTFRDSTVREELSRYVLVKYQAEKPGVSPAREIMKHFGVLGLPTYVILRPVR